MMGCVQGCRWEGTYVVSHAAALVAMEYPFALEEVIEGVDVAFPQLGPPPMEEQHWTFSSSREWKGSSLANRQWEMEMEAASGPGAVVVASAVREPLTTRCACAEDTKSSRTSRQ